MTQSAAPQYTIYFGTYTNPKSDGPTSEGIYRSTLDAQSGELSEPELAAVANNPSFLAISPDGRYLYATLEMHGGAVGGWEIGDGGELTEINQQSSGGNGACHVWVDATGRNVLVANYGSGNIACLPVQNDGSLEPISTLIQHKGSGPNRNRQESPHAHAIYTDPANAFVYACDLGTDEVKIYRFDAAQGTLIPNEPPSGKVPPGGGPRHFAMSANGFAYANNEMEMSVTVFARDTNGGALTAIETVPTLPPGADKTNVSTAEIFLHPTGRWLYVSNRGHDSIAVFEVGDDGRLSVLEHKPTPREPRGFGISPDGRWLVVGGQNEHRVEVFGIDAETGKLQTTGHNVQVATPICVAFAAL